MANACAAKSKCSENKSVWSRISSGCAIDYCKSREAYVLKAGRCISIVKQSDSQCYDVKLKIIHDSLL